MEELEYLKEWVMAVQPDSVSDILKKIDSILEGEPLSMPAIHHINFSPDAVTDITKKFLEAFESSREEIK
jgi:hypothetical protein